MAAFTYLVLGATALSSMFFSPAGASLVLRQDTNDTIPVGSNLYNCHDNCGEAIEEEAVDGFCNSTIFSTDYAACLQCAGPDNEDIWQYYGSYLTEGAAQCGSSTEPLTGTQADVSTALPASNATSTATTTESSSAAATTTPSAGQTTSGSAAATSTSTKSGAVQEARRPEALIIGGVSLIAILAASLVI